jgi:hypothetical protein
VPVRAEFHRPDPPGHPVGSAEWTPAGVRIRADDEAIRSALGRIFRRTPVVVDDPALRPAGASGPAVVQPGSLTWFQAAARSRSAAEGLAVRIVPEERGAFGWDPAGSYRPFAEAIARKAAYHP